VELIEAKEKGKFAPMRKANDDVPERLDLIVDKMLAKDPKLRYETCEAIVAELEALEMHNDQLSFLEGASAAPAKTGLSKGVGAQKTAKPIGKGATMPPDAGKTAAGIVTAKTTLASEFYYWQMTTDDGKHVTKKLKKEQIVTLIKSGSIDATDQVSKTPKGGYRALGTFVEFAAQFKGALTKEKADKKTDKFKSMYKQIESEEKSRQRWRFLKNLGLKTGGFVGLVLWLCVVAGVVIGGYFLVRWAIGFMGDTVSKAGAL